MITYPHVKVNLGLNVLRKRPDGYHDLETLFLPCREISDTLEIISGDDWSRTSASLFARYDSCAQAVSPDGRLMITIARKEGVGWEPLEDLTAKAYALLSEDHDLPPVKIFLEKKSPVGAGLGGGSSDGAAALSMISELFSLGLSREELASYAARLGSDCAFFVYDRPMFGEGRGDVLSPYEINLDEFRMEVIVPEGISVSTAEAYRGVVPSVPALRLKEALSGTPESWKESVFNDFEKTVFAAHPSLAALKEDLYRMGAVYASMSGSGSALFGLFRR